MRRVLIVTSSYAPTMIADMHRARQLAWELPQQGWEVEILSPSTEFQREACIDADSDGLFPPHSHAHYAPAMARGLFRIAGMRSIGWRALLPLWLAGQRLLRQRKFDLVYFSTSQLPLLLLGRLWQRQFGVPYIVDVHDPLYNEHADHPVWARPSLKHRLSHAVSGRLEKYVVSAANGLIAVSPHYIYSLRRRYQTRQPAWLRPGHWDVIPFSARPGDLREVAHGMGAGSAKKGAPCRIVYVGAGGPIMKRSFTLLCQALSRSRQSSPHLCERIRIELFGTMSGWRPGDPRYLADIAAAHGIGALIREEPAWTSYRRSLELLLQSDGALILGVDEVGYMPSKLFSYSLSGKPLLAVLHREGPAFAQFQRGAGMGHALWIGQNCAMPLADATAELEVFLREVVARQAFDRESDLMPHLAPAMAQRHIELFETCLSD